MATKNRIALDVDDPDAAENASIAAAADALAAAHGVPSLNPPVRRDPGEPLVDKKYRVRQAIARALAIHAVEQGVTENFLVLSALQQVYGLGIDEADLVEDGRKRKR